MNIIWKFGKELQIFIQEVFKMKSLIEFSAAFFSKNQALKKSVKIAGLAYGPENVAAVQKFKSINKFNFIDETDQATIYRGGPVEYYLGSSDQPVLGPTAMRPGLARYLKNKKYTCIEDLSNDEKKEIMDKHVHGLSLLHGNTKIALSFSSCPSVALTFGIHAAKSSNFPKTSIIGVTKNVCKFGWGVNYNKPNLFDEHVGNSFFTYQCETIVPFLISPMDHCIVVNQKQSDIIQLDDLTQAKRFDASEHSILELSTISPEKMKKYQQLEIDKVIAYDDFGIYISGDKDPNDSKAIELYEKYKSLAKEQAALFNLPLCKKDQWINIAYTVAPKTYSCIYADHDGFTIELPTKIGGLLGTRVSNMKAMILLAPLFEADPTLTLEQVKNGVVPSALNYLTESVIRKNKGLICQTGLEKCVEEEQTQQLTFK